MKNLLIVLFVVLSGFAPPQNPTEEYLKNSIFLGVTSSFSEDISNFMFVFGSGETCTYHKLNEEGEFDNINMLVYRYKVVEDELIMYVRKDKKVIEESSKIIFDEEGFIMDRGDAWMSFIKVSDYPDSTENNDYLK